MGTIAEGPWDDLSRLIFMTQEHAKKHDERILTRILREGMKEITAGIDWKIQSVERRWGVCLGWEHNRKCSQGISLFCPYCP